MSNRPSKTRRRPVWVGIDTGGTFTDLCALWDDRWLAFKVPSTPDDPARAVLAALTELHRRRPELRSRPTTVVHGSTVATNALLEGAGASVVLVCNEGFEDLLEIGRQAREELYALEPTRPEPWVERRRRLGIRQRTAADGRELERPSDSELRKLAKRVSRARPEAIAIGLLHSWRDSGPEKRLAEALRELGVPVCISSEVAPLFREFERFSTTVANAKLLPLLRDYLERLERELPVDEFLVQQSNGGLTSVSEAARTPVRLVLSGPAGGMAGAARWLEAVGVGAALTLDMGGTSTDVGVVEGGARRTDRLEVASRPLLVESLDLETIGAGGGSLAWIDEGGALRVGPRSAGADPGPACYGKGSQPTVTDAHAVLGRLPLEHALGGEIHLDRERALQAFEPLAQSLNRSADEVASAVLDVADAHMERALRRVSLERGHDPRTFALFSFGGAGGLHACRLAARLEMEQVIVPPAPGATSAFGMAVSSPCFDASRACVEQLDDPAGMRRARALAGELERQLRADLERSFGPGTVKVETEVRCRFVGQSYELGVLLGRDSVTRFRQRHLALYGFDLEHSAVECVALHLRASRPRRSRTPAPPPRTQGTSRTCSAHFPRRARGALTSTLGRRRRASVVDRETLHGGESLAGPSIVLEETATTIVEPGFVAHVDEWGCLRIRRDKR